jgi:putative transposase
VETLGLLLAVVVTTADVHDAVAATQVLGQLNRTDYPRLAKLFADSKYHNYQLYAWLNEHSDGAWAVEVKNRPEGSKGFVVIPKRWVVERTFAWFGRCRRLSKDYERKTESSEGMIQISTIHLLVHCLAPEPLKHSQRFRYKKNRNRAA